MTDRQAIVEAALERRVRGVFYLEDLHESRNAMQALRSEYQLKELNIVCTKHPDAGVVAQSPGPEDEACLSEETRGCVWIACRECRGLLAPLKLARREPRSIKVPISSLRVEIRGGHAHVSVWARGGLAGVLTVAACDADALVETLRGPQTKVERSDR